MLRSWTNANRQAFNFQKHLFNHLNENRWDRRNYVENFA